MTLHGLVFRTVSALSGPAERALARVTERGSLGSAVGSTVVPRVVLAAVDSDVPGPVGPGEAFLAGVAVTHRGLGVGEPETVARLTAVLLAPDGVSRIDSCTDADQLKAVLREILTAEGYYTPAAVQAWGKRLGNPGEAAIAVVEELWIDPRYRDDSSVRLLASYACALASFVAGGEAAGHAVLLLPRTPGTTPVDGRDVEALNWLKGSLARIGATLPRLRAVGTGADGACARVLLPAWRRE